MLELTVRPNPDWDKETRAEVMSFLCKLFSAIDEQYPYITANVSKTGKLNLTINGFMSERLRLDATANYAKHEALYEKEE